MLVVDYIPRKKEAAEEIVKRPNWTNYMILDLNNMNYDRELFSFAIEILGTCNFFITVNKLFRETNSHKQVDTGILYQAIDYVLNNEPFTEGQLKQWFNFWVEFEKISDLLLKLYEVDQHYVSSDIDLIFLGLSYKEIKDVRGKDHHGILSDKYTDLFADMRREKTDVDTFILQAREIVKEMKGLR